MSDVATPESTRQDRIRALRRRVYEVMEIAHGEDRASRIFDVFIVTLIVLNVAAFIAETVPWLYAAYHPYFFAFELFSVAIFTVEYGLRLWTAVEMPFLRRMSPTKARFVSATRPSLVIDLLAILPFYLSQFFAVDLRVLRTLRLLRFLKLSRYSPAMHSLIRVVVNERRALIGAGLLLFAAVLFASTGMYYLENDAQPDKFGSVPDSAWWAMATLTTVGYGDVAPITPLGRLFGSVVMVTGLCILALPVAIIATGFAQEVSRRDFVVTWSLMSRIPVFTDLDARDVGHLMPLLHAHNFPPNFEVIPEGAHADAMYFVASGKVEERAADAKCAQFAAGDVIGARPLFNHDVHPNPMITTTRCRLLKLHREDFHRLEVTHPALSARIRHATASI